MADDITPEPAPAFDPTAFSNEDLAAELTRVAERGRELSGKAEFADGEAEELATLAEHLPALQAEVARRNDAVAAEQARRDAFASVEISSLATVAPLAPLAAPVAAEQPAPVSPAHDTLKSAGPSSG